MANPASTEGHGPSPASVSVSEVDEPELGPSTSGAVSRARRRHCRVAGRAGRLAGGVRRAAPPPLPHDLRRTGIGWLIAATAAVIAAALIFRNGVRGVAINVIVVDDTIVRWMSNVDLPGIDGVARGVSYAASWWTIQLTILVLDVALIVFRRWRLLVIYLVVSQLAQLVADAPVRRGHAPPVPSGFRCEEAGAAGRCRRSRCWRSPASGSLRCTRWCPRVGSATG